MEVITGIFCRPNKKDNRKKWIPELEKKDFRMISHLLLFKTRATPKARSYMTNFPYDIQMTAMFIFITLYLVMEIIF